MKTSLALVLLAQIFFSGILCFADPVIHVDEPLGPGVPVGLDFTFFSDGSGGGFLSFINASGVNWTRMEIDVPAPDPIAPITCTSNVFTCTQRAFATAGFYATFDFTGGTGIGNGATFTIDLGSSGWTPDALFAAYANPEPGTMLLFATGLVPFLYRRR